MTIKVDEETGIPTNWSVTYDKTKRIAYFLVDPNEDIDAVAQPCYTDYLPKENSDKNGPIIFMVIFIWKQDSIVSLWVISRSKQMMMSKKNLLKLQQNCICKEMVA